MVGAKVTLMVQLPLEARELEQLLVWLKSPLAVIELMASAPVPELVRVTDFDALAVPAAWLPKTRLLGLRVAVPVPPPDGSST
jgi:hypothetical protein